MALPKSVLPKRYFIEIEVGGDTFKGHEEIEIVANKKVKEIAINCREIDVRSCALEAKGKESSCRFSLDKKEEILKIKLDGEFEGEGKLIIDFIGKHNEKMYGFYKSTYEHEGKKNLFTTQFEPTDARSAFPCFDEPSFKARFKIALKVEKEMEAISNMPIEKVEYENDKKVVSFKETPPMSTYLVYLGVGRFVKKGRIVDGTKVNAIGVEGREEFLKAPLSYAEKLLKYYNNYFKQKYPLPKLDLIAIPDFAVGAMENWGAITFRETNLLVNENSAKTSLKRCADVISHEMAHQWFGDLVTMEWWDDLWLNESFASFMNVRSTSKVFPEFYPEEFFYYEDIDEALSIDQLENTHPIRMSVRSPAETASLFDTITYEKGASLLSMVEDYMGESKFRDGIREYIKKYKYSNVKAVDLFNSLEAQERGVRNMISKWIEQEGYPIVEIRNNKIYQSRFVLSNKRHKEVWDIPIRYKGKGEEGKFILKGKIGDFAGKEIVKLNYMQKGIYRVLYSKEHADSILSSGFVSNLDRAGVFSDIFAEMRAGRFSLEDYLSLLEKHYKSLEFPANSVAIAQMEWLWLILNGTSKHEKVDEIMRKAIRHVIEKIGKTPRKGEPIYNVALRIEALVALAKIKEKDVVEFVKSKFEEIRKGKAIEPDLFRAVVVGTASNGGREMIEELLNMYEKEKVPERRVTFLLGLGTLPSEALIKDAFEISFSKRVRLGDTPFVIGSIGENEHGNNKLWYMIKDNWDTLEEKYAVGTLLLNKAVNSMNFINSEETYNDMKEFFSSKKPRKDIEKDVKRVIENTKYNIDFVKAATQ
ncbi:MAG: M1 family metallopeptidase [Candidatus Micrarchaeaceae archaeon]